MLVIVDFNVAKHQFPTRNETINPCPVFCKGLRLRFCEARDSCNGVHGIYQGQPVSLFYASSLLTISSPWQALHAFNSFLSSSSTTSSTLPGSVSFHSLVIHKKKIIYFFAHKVHCFDFNSRPSSSISIGSVQILIGCLFPLKF